MPNHVHMVIKPNTEYSLERIIKGIKGVSARLINRSRDERGMIWMEEYFDRIIRTESDLEEKLKYMFENPVKAGFVEDGSKYHGWYFSSE